MGVEEFARRVGGAAHHGIALGHRIEGIDVGAGQRVTLGPVRAAAMGTEDRLGTREMTRTRHLLIMVHRDRSKEQPSELQSLMRTSYAVFSLKNKMTTTSI